MANTSSRALRLLSLLQSHRHWAGTDLAQRLGVSLRTLRRDVDRLRELGYPVNAQRGLDGGYQLAPGAAMPPLVLDDEEAVALAIGLLAAAQSPVAGIAEASVRALSKVIAVMPKRLRHRVENLRATTEAAAWAPTVQNVDPQALTTAAQACRDTERLHFDYITADHQRSQRHVEPHRLVSLDRNWYLVAYDIDRHDWRSFRLDRLTASRATGARFAPRPLPAHDAAAFVRAGIAHAPRAFIIEAVVAAPADVVRAQIGRWATVQDQEGGCKVHINAESLDWAAFALAVIDAEFQLQGPPEMVEHLRGWKHRLTRAIETWDSDVPV